MDKHFSELERLGLSPMEIANESLLLQILTIKVARLMEDDLDLLFSFLYRMDIDERKVQETIHPSNPVPAAEGLAKLILERQKQRQQTKKNTSVDPIDPDLAW